MNSLPYEILNQILTEFVDQLYKESGLYGEIPSEPYFDKLAYTELITLRLISKTWSKAVIQFYFHTIVIDCSRRAKLILENWTDTLFGPHLPCPVRRLTIVEVWDSQAEGSNAPSKTSGLGAPSTDQVARLIDLLGPKLHTLNITLKYCMRAPPDLIKAIKTIEELKTLRISFENPRTAGTYQLDSSSELFSAIPTLKNLSLNFNSLGGFNLNPLALSNLRYFSFPYYKQNLEVISGITRASRNTLKFIELDTAIEPPEALRQVFEPIKDKLEGLFANSILDQLSKSVTSMDFPSLRVIGTRSLLLHHLGSKTCLQAPIFKNVRTLIADLPKSETYWIHAFNSRFVNVYNLRKLSNFKHIVFTHQVKHSESRVIDPKLVETLKSYGVQCHLTHQLTSDEILDLDNKLNGPMK